MTDVCHASMARLGTPPSPSPEKPMFTVNPKVIDPNGYAEITNNGSSDITVTITNQSGAQQTVPVPAGDTVKWYPPVGWTQARFTAPGCDEVFRYIRATDTDGETAS